MTDMRWARVRPDSPCQLRRGAWYRILRQTPQEVVLDVHARPVGVSRSLVQMRPGHPGVWSVVARPPRAGALLSSWGPRYAVCPNCHDRSRLGTGATMRCGKCSGVFEIGWEDAS